MIIDLPKLLTSPYTYCDIDIMTGCWLFRHSLNDSGYPRGSLIQDRRHNRGMSLHRQVYEITHRTRLHRTVQVCHKCDVRCCINPEHLFEGTAEDNVWDAILKDRRANQTGSLNNASNLTDEIVLEIRRICSDKSIFQRDVAKQFNLSVAQVSRIVNRKQWTHI